MGVRGVWKTLSQQRQMDRNISTHIAHDNCNSRGFAQPLPRAEENFIVKVPKRCTVLSNESDDVYVGMTTQQSWRISNRVWNSIPLFYDIVGAVVPGTPTIDILPLLHGGRQVCPGAGWGVFTRDNKWIMPVHEYMDIVLRWMHTSEADNTQRLNLLACFTTLRSITFFENFVAMLFKREFMCARNCESLHPLHVCVLKLIEAQLGSIHDAEETSRQLDLIPCGSRNASVFTLSCLGET